MIKGVCCSAFYLLHPGHVAHLQEAKENCDWLIAALHINPKEERDWKNKPIESAFERYARLKGCKYVDEIIPYETEEDLRNLILSIKPDIRFLGEEYQKKSYSNEDLPIKIMFTSRKHNFSTTKLREKLDAKN